MPRIAIVHDNFAQMGGAERVAEAIYNLLPGADLYTTLSVPERLSPGLRAARIKTSWMQCLPARSKLYRHYFCLYPFAIEGMDLTEYDLVVSSCFGYAKGINTRPDATHICYCHTPPRWIWRYGDYSAREEFNPLTKALLPPLLSKIRRWDIKASRKPSYFIANSRVIASRIRDTYKRDAFIINPPIETKRFFIAERPGKYYLVLSRLVPYKRIDLAIRACAALGRQLVVIGDGPDRRRLESLAGPTVKFLGRQPDTVVTEHLARCAALLFTGEEDFGMAPLEANASGRPVIAFRGGGTTDTIVEQETGLFFDQPVSAAVEAGILDCESRFWEPSALRRHAESYSREVFESRFLSFIDSVIGSPAKHPIAVVASA
jgi:glycosyltransferase involved in cell wall biosynthesis